MTTSLTDQYRQRYSTVLRPLAEKLRDHLLECFREVSRIDRIVTRAKSIERFVGKAEKQINGVNKYTDPLRQVQDQIGARIVTFYLNDVDQVAEVAQQYFRHIEMQDIVPDSEREFDYFGKHFIMFLPRDVFNDQTDEKNAPTFFELQIKTLFQHAWAEANHNLGYKPESDLSSLDKRKIAFSSAQAWGADMIFNDLQGEVTKK